MLRVFPWLAIACILTVGLFPGLVNPPVPVPVPYCNGAGAFVPTAQLTGSDIILVPRPLDSQEAVDIAHLEIELDRLRQRLSIPAFSAAIVKNQEVLWARGFGCADIASNAPATPHTPYHLASLTKPFGATILLQLVEEGLVELDDPVSEYGVYVESDGVARVKHLLSHTSAGTPGRRYRYCGDCFGLIERIMLQATDRSFRGLLIERILTPLGLEDTLPSPANSAEAHGYGLGTAEESFQSAWDRIATPYVLYEGAIHEWRYVTYFGSAAGLISSVVDFAAFDAAIDEHVFVSEETQELAWTPFESNSGRDLAYGYGWFVQHRKGLRYLWHYGYWDCTSTLIVKVPERGLTFLLFANSDRLSSPFWLGVDENVRRSPAARIFLDIFVESSVPRVIRSSSHPSVG